jgi:CheY-like chemotaxis protein
MNILLVDDDEKVGRETSDLLSSEIIEEIKMNVEYLQDYSTAISKLNDGDYDIAIFDLFKGTPSEENPERFGEDLLKDLQKTCFIPVIFFTGLIKPVENLQSNIIKVVRKSEGVPALKSEIKNILDTKIINVKRSINHYVKENIRQYFWEFVQPAWENLKNYDDISLGYLLVRRLANSLTKENVIEFLDDPKIKPDFAYPMEYYVYPPVVKEYESGDILKFEGDYYVILTPSCDFVKRKNGRIRAEQVLLVKCKLLSETQEFKHYLADKANPAKTDNIKKLIESRKGDRYFFIPKAPFIENSVLDFQELRIINHAQLADTKKIACLDSPYNQSMQSSFIRYYNRIGTPDIDADFILSNY